MLYKGFSFFNKHMVTDTNAHQDGGVVGQEKAEERSQGINAEHCKELAKKRTSKQCTGLVQAKYRAPGRRGRCAHPDGRAPGKEDTDGMALVIE